MIVVQLRIVNIAFATFSEIEIKMKFLLTFPVKDYFRIKCSFRKWKKIVENQKKTNTSTCPPAFFFHLCPLSFVRKMSQPFLTHTHVFCFKPVTVDNKAEVPVCSASGSAVSITK